MKRILMISAASLMLISGSLTFANAAQKEGNSEAATCTWGGQSYSQGARHTEPNGDTYECTSEGKWDKVNVVKGGGGKPITGKLPSGTEKAK